jgi:hypothetical protein
LAAVLILWKTAPVMWVGIALAVVIVGWHVLAARTKARSVAA